MRLIGTKNEISSQIARQIVKSKSTVNTYFHGYQMLTANMKKQGIASVRSCCGASVSQTTLSFCSVTKRYSP